MNLINLLGYTCIFNVVTYGQLSILSAKLPHPESVITDGHYIYTANVGKEMQPMLKMAMDQSLK
jgi:hypothetical protein